MLSLDISCSQARRKTWDWGTAVTPSYLTVPVKVSFMNSSDRELVWFLNSAAS